MSRIALISNSFMSLYNFRHEFIYRLMEEHEVILICPMEEGDDLRSEDYRSKGCRIIDISIVRRGKNPFTDMALEKRFYSLLKQEKPDLVITYTIKCNIYAGRACIKLGIPYFINITGIGVAFEKAGLLKMITTLLYKKPYAKAERIFFQNEDNRNIFHEAGLKSDDELMVPGSGINLKRFAYREYKPEYMNTFIYIARLQKAKGTDEFLEAACKMKDRHDDVSFVVLGKCEEAYEEQVAKLQADGVLKYYGWRDDAIDFIDKSGCMINPSYHEGMSNVCLEAAALGRPLIVTNIAGCREIVDDGVNGFLIPTHDADSLLGKMEAFYNMTFEEKKAMGASGRTKIEKEFDRNKVIDIYINEINRSGKNL